MERWSEKWSREARESYEVLRKEAWAADEHGHRWFQLLASPGLVREVCGVGGCATKRQRAQDNADWELLCGLCDQSLGAKPAGPCEGCLDMRDASS